ncbi:LAMI_0E11584g1_1 [Lachancea mirantina]|uniref:Protein transport protein SEC31 n=1 Tax=Lachancea mirantina TaxID=1230905 RepID=A0A1G4JPS8_9SACH|nr:LAMI_0E11584g1_1 [Lachancea mirantina]
MVKLAEYARTATFAWSHDKAPLLATGTASGAIDADFSSESTLELWSLLSPHSSKPEAAISADAKFNDLDWSHDSQVIAGALENGTVEFFSAPERASVAKIAKHTTPVKTLKFNSKQVNVLASGGSKGEIYIWDANKVSSEDYSPFVPGTAMTPLDEIFSLSWNQNQSHVFASAGSSGFASIWDLKAKKEVIHLSYLSPVTGTKNQLSIVEWHPNNSTKIATASGNDSDPSVLVWDLRNANAPLRVLSHGHNKGVLSLDWCKQDESLLLSSGRDNTCVLWNPEEGQKLVQYPTRGNWIFKTKFAPAAPDLFASASFDNKIEVQTLQDLTTTLDLDESVTKQQESEVDFWNNVSEQKDTEKPIVSQVQAPAWYETKSSARWAFGGKLVYVSGNGKNVTIANPSIPGIEQNTLLDKALQTSDFNPIINKRLAQSLDNVNEEDWTMLEKLSLDGPKAFLEEALSFDDEEDENSDEKKGNEEDDFFSKLNEKFEPSGPFKLEAESESIEIIQSLLRKNYKAAISTALEKDLLLESLVIALDSNDEVLKKQVKEAYFSKRSHDSPLARTLYCFSSQNPIDMVENLDVEQWKYAAKAVITLEADAETKNELLVKLGDKLLASDKRQDALILFVAAHSLDKVASVWLSESSELESKMRSKKASVYEAHLECLTEFVERFTVFSRMTSALGDSKFVNQELVSKLLEFVNLTSSNGNFDLALRFLETLPESNEEVATEKQRVLIASNKTDSATAKTKKHKYGSESAVAPGPFNQASNLVKPGLVSTSPFAQPATLATRTPSIGGSASSVARQNSYIATGSNLATPMNKYAPVGGVTAAPSSVPVTVPSAFGGQTNPYAAPAPSANPYAPPQAMNTGFVASAAAASGNFTNGVSLPYNPIASVIPLGDRGFNDLGAGMTRPPSEPSGQSPHLNKKANDGWNDLPLSVKEKSTRAKAVSVAPVSIHNPVASVPGAQAPSSRAVPPPPLSRVTSSATVATPPPQNATTKALPPSAATSSSTPSNPYTPPMKAVAPPLMNSQSIAPPTPPLNPYAPPVATTAAPAAAANAYAPSVATSTAPPVSNPYAPSPAAMVSPTPATMAYGSGPPLNGFTSNPPPTKPSVGPPPKTMNRKTHASQQVDSANALLDSMQNKALPVQAASELPPVTGSQPPASAESSLTETPSQNAPSGIPADQEPIVEFLQSELARVSPLIPREYSKQLKDCNKRLNILFGHLERQDLLTPPTIAKLQETINFMKEQKYEEAMQCHVEIATNHSQEAGNWLTGVKRLISIAEVTST